MHSDNDLQIRLFKQKYQLSFEQIILSSILNEKNMTT